MTDKSQQLSAHEAIGELLDDALVDNESGERGELEELRALLFGNDYQPIKQLAEEIRHPAGLAGRMAEALPSAVILSRRHDASLNLALSSSVEEGLKNSVKRNPKVLADAIFPVIGPAIRRSVMELVTSMLDGFNNTLERQISPQSFKWRWEAKRTGKSLAEVIMLRTLEFQVEQVFLIHKETSLLLRHESSHQAVVQDADMVSSMLSAIQDFITDSFSVKEGDKLHSMQLGDLKVQIEEGPHAILAAVVRGIAPITVSEVMKESIEQIHMMHGEELADFSGDTEPFEPAATYLQDCLLSKELETDNAKKKKGPGKVPIAIGIALIAGLAWWAWSSYQGRVEAAAKNATWNSINQRLEAAPGIVVVSSTADLDTGMYRISGMRDPLAEDPLRVANPHEVAKLNVQFKWQPYLSMEPEFALERIRTTLKTPSSVALELGGDGRLLANGHAPQSWVDRFVDMAPTLPGVMAINTANLVASDAQTLKNASEFAQQRKEVLNRLSAEPGYAISGIAEQDNELQAQLLRDPLARPLNEVVSPEVRESLKVRLSERPFMSMEPQFAVVRIASALQTPPGVNLSLDDNGLLSAVGAAPQSWIDQFTTQALGLAGVDRIDTSALTADNLEELAAAQALVLQQAEFAARRQALVDTVRSEPGFVITSNEEVGERLALHILRDPLARSLNDVVSDKLRDDLRLNLLVRPYVSVEPEFQLKRLRVALEAPESALLEMDGNNKLTISGEAPGAWIASLGERTRRLRGVSEVDFKAIRDSDRHLLLAIAQASDAIDSSLIHFVSGQTSIPADEQSIIEDTSAAIFKLIENAKALSKEARISIIGHSDQGGSEEINRQLSLGRAKTVLEALTALGHNPRMFRVLGVGTTQPAREERSLEDQDFNRRVSFETVLQNQ